MEYLHSSDNDNSKVGKMIYRRTSNGCLLYIPQRRLFPEYPEQDRQHHRNDYAGRDREIEAEIFSLDIDITRKMTEAHPGKPGPGNSKQKKNDTDDNEQLCHEHYLWIGRNSPSPNKRMLPSYSRKVTFCLSINIGHE
jgi:hypothetical protein